MAAGPRYVQMQSEPSASMTSSYGGGGGSSAESTRIFDELPRATIVSVSRPDHGDISPMLLTYTIEIEYKQFKWQLVKKASQVFYLHFALKKRAFFEEIHEKQEQVREWLQNLGIGDHTELVQDDDEADDETLPLHNDESTRTRWFFVQRCSLECSSSSYSSSSWKTALHVRPSKGRNARLLE